MESSKHRVEQNRAERVHEAEKAERMVIEEVAMNPGLDEIFGSHADHRGPS
jgi:hypothetical protein